MTLHELDDIPPDFNAGIGRARVEVENLLLGRDPRDAAAITGDLANAYVRASTGEVTFDQLDFVIALSAALVTERHVRFLVQRRAGLGASETGCRESQTDLTRAEAQQAPLPQPP